MLTATSLFWLLIGLLVCFHSYRIGLGEASSPGPGFIFFVSGILLVLSSIGDFFITFKKREKAQIVLKRLWAGTNWKNILLVLAISFAYLFILQFIGFFFSTLILMSGLFGIAGKNNVWRIALAAFLTAIAGYVVFVHLLKIPFPEGIIGF